MARKQRPAQSHLIFSGVYRFYLGVFHFWPRYLYHFFKRPYCQSLLSFEDEIERFAQTLAPQDDAGSGRDDGPILPTSAVSVPSPPSSGQEPSHPHALVKVRKRFRLKRPRTKRPSDVFCQTPQSIEARTMRMRAIRASCDAVVSFSLGGYVELTGAEVAPGSGQLLFLLTEIIRSLDDYLDQQLLAGRPPTMMELLTVPEVQETIARFYSHLGTVSRTILILKHLRYMYVTNYQTYIKSFFTVMESLQFEDALQVAAFDSGTMCRLMMEVVCLFNGHQIDYEQLHDFYLFGMVAKFADDLVDLASDIKKGYPNLFALLIRRSPEEDTRLQLALKKGKRLTLAWCKKHCPLTCLSYFTCVEQYYEQIQSSQVRILALLTFGQPSTIPAFID